MYVANASRTYRQRFQQHDAFCTFSACRRSFPSQSIDLFLALPQKRPPHQHIENRHVVPLVLPLRHKPIKCLEEIVLGDVPRRRLVRARDHLAQLVLRHHLISILISILNYDSVFNPNGCGLITLCMISRSARLHSGGGGQGEEALRTSLSPSEPQAAPFCGKQQAASIYSSFFAS